MNDEHNLTEMITLNDLGGSVSGYKAFNADYTNRYGASFSEGKSYDINGKITFGNDGNGFHMCRYLSDVFRYFDSSNVVVAQVVGYGNKVQYDDEYNGYYEMYAVEKIFIQRFMTREEIIATMLRYNSALIEHFLSTFRLNNDEIKLFINSFFNSYNVLEKILYYQLNKRDIFQENKVFDEIRELKKVYTNGQDNC